MPLALLSAAFAPRTGRGALGISAAVSGFAVSLGPLLGRAVVEGISWHWIFCLNVPVGLALMALATGALLADAFVAWKLRAGAPTLALRLLRSRRFAGGNATIFFTGGRRSARSTCQRGSCRTSSGTGRSTLASA